MNKNITIRNTQSLDSFLKDASKHPLLTIEEEITLVKRIQNGDEDAINCLSEANLRFVVSVAKQYLNRGKSLEELIEAGNRGLELAARKFDPNRGFKFMPYAVWHIRESIVTLLGSKMPDTNPSELTEEMTHEIISKCTNEKEKE